MDMDCDEKSSKRPSTWSNIVNFVLCLLCLIVAAAFSIYLYFLFRNVQMERLHFVTSATNPTTTASGNGTTDSTNVTGTGPAEPQNTESTETTESNPTTTSGNGTTDSTNITGTGPAEPQNTESTATTESNPTTTASGNGTTDSTNITGSGPAEPQNTESTATTESNPTATASGNGTTDSTNITGSGPAEPQNTESTETTESNPTTTTSGNGTTDSTNVTGTGPAEPQNTESTETTESNPTTTTSGNGTTDSTNITGTEPAEPQNTTSAEGTVTPTTTTESTLAMLNNSLLYLNTSVDPCDDFFEFACGNFDETKLTSFEERVKRVTADAKIAFENHRKLLNSSPEPVKAMYEFYDDCVKIEHSNETLMKEVEHFIESIGGIPFMKGSAWNSVSFDFVLEKLLSFGFLPIFQFTQLDQFPDLLYQFDVLTTESVMEENKRIDREIKYDSTFKIYAETNEVVEKYRESKEMFKFIDEIASIVTSENQSEKVFTIDEMREKLPKVNFTMMIRWMETTKEYSAVQGVTNVVMGINDTQLDRLSKLFERTPQRVWIDYALTSFYFHMKVLNEQNNFTAGDCFEIVKESHGFALSYVYLQEFSFNNSLVMEMMENIRTTLRAKLRDYSWMDNQTRENSIKKLDATLFFIGAPAIELDLEDFYFMVPDLSSAGFFQRWVVMMRMMKNAESFVTFRRNTSTLSTLEPAVYYTPELGNLFVTNAMLYQPMYDANNPAFWNYARLGSAIGHELVHAFDAKGMQYDESGMMRSISTSETEAHYEMLTFCFKSLYESEYFRNTSLDERDNERVLVENIADNGGLDFAYKALKRFASRADDVSQLDGYSEEQSFFIAAAQEFCGKENERETLADNMPINKFRVNYNVRNNDDFAAAFSCAVGSKLNPPADKKCRIF